MSYTLLGDIPVVEPWNLGRHKMDKVRRLWKEYKLSIAQIRALTGDFSSRCVGACCVKDK